VSLPVPTSEQVKPLPSGTFFDVASPMVYNPAEGEARVFFNQA
jgi:hypothetical protein